MRDALVARGIAVHLVGDVYEVDSEGGVLPEEVRRKWCVSVPAESSLAAVVQGIPLGDTEEQAWEHALSYLAAREGMSAQVVRGAQDCECAAVAHVVSHQARIIGMMKGRNMTNETLIRIRNGLFCAAVLGVLALAFTVVGTWALVPAGTDLFRAWAVAWDAHGALLLGANVVGFVYGFRRNRASVRRG